MSSPHIPLNKRIRQILSKERNMQTTLKKSTTFLLSITAIIFTAFVVGQTWANASEASLSNDLSKKIHHLDELKMKQQFPAKMMNTLNEALAEGGWFTKLDYSGTNLSAAGFARSNDQVAQFLTTLKKPGGILYNGMLLSSTKFSEGGRDKFFFRANFSCKTASADKKSKKKVNEKVLANLERGLAKKNDVRGIVEKIEAMLSDSQLKITQWTSAPSLSRSVYGEFSQKVDLQGNYHNLTSFFNNLARMDKVVTINELYVESQSLTEGDFTVTARFIFSLFIKDKGE
jgi:Tfp pilus assembly protein PilN